MVLGAFDLHRRYDVGVDGLPRPFGPFLLLKSLGSGASGDVLIARPLDPDSNLPTPVVVKRMHRSLVSQPEQHARFHHEARIALALSTPHVPKIHIVGEAEGTSFIAMDFVPGWTLSRVTRGRKEVERAISVNALVDVIRGTLNGLMALHEAKDPSTGQPLDALHRDLAPKNIMLGEDGVTRLIDLGLGKSTVQDWQTMTGVIMGTPGYMAPEQVYASKVDLRADLYTVGVVLWELLANESYIPRGPIHRMLRDQAQLPYRPLPAIPGVPVALGEVLARAMALAPHDRFDSARAFLNAVDQATVGLPPGEGPVAELVTRTMWDELAADQDEVLDLTQAIPVPVVAQNGAPRARRRPALDADTQEATPGAFAPTVASPALALDQTHVPSAPTVPATRDLPFSRPMMAPYVGKTPDDEEEPTEAYEVAAETLEAPVLLPKVHSPSANPRPPATAPVHHHPPPPARIGRTLLIGLAIVSLGTALGIGSVVVFRLLTEEPAPALVRRVPPPKATTTQTRLDTLLKRARALEARSANARLSELLKTLNTAQKSGGSPTREQLDQWEALVDALERRPLR